MKIHPSIVHGIVFHKDTCMCLNLNGLHVASDCTEVKVCATVTLMESLSDVVNDSEDCSGVISSTPVTELFAVFSPREWLFGIWTNVNCDSEHYRVVGTNVQHVNI